MTENEIDALIRLLDDPDKNVFAAVENKIMAEGEVMIPALEKAWTLQENNSLLQKRVEKIVPAIESNAMAEKFQQWGREPSSIHQAAWLISRLQNFQLTDVQFAAQYHQLKIQLYQYGFSNYSPLEHIKIMNYIFFRKMGFRPCRPDEFVDPSTSFPSSVIATKVGNPESLALLYMMLAQDAGLPIVGVNLPKNFILAYHDRDLGTRFYVNPTTNGAIFSKGEIDNFLDQLKLSRDLRYYSPCSNVTFVHRLLIRLEFSYRYQGHKSLANKIKRIIDTLPGKLDSSIEWA